MTDRTNAQIALMCAVEATTTYDRSEDALTAEIVRRAEHFLAFLVDADESAEADRREAGA